MTKIVLVDMDGVLAGYTYGFSKIWRERYPDLLHIPPEEQKSFYLIDDYPPELRTKIEAIENSQGFYRNLLPLPGSIVGINELSALPGVEVFICSSPSISAFEYCVLEKYQWVDHYLGREFTKRLILTKDKTLVRGQYLIDDKPQITGELEPIWEHLIYDQPYNVGIPGRHFNWNNYKWLVDELLT